MLNDLVQTVANACLIVGIPIAILMAALALAHMAWTFFSLLLAEEEPQEEKPEEKPVDLESVRADVAKGLWQFPSFAEALAKRYEAAQTGLEKAEELRKKVDQAYSVPDCYDVKAEMTGAIVRTVDTDVNPEVARLTRELQAAEKENLVMQGRVEYLQKQLNEQIDNAKKGFDAKDEAFEKQAVCIKDISHERDMYKCFLEARLQSLVEYGVVKRPLPDADCLYEKYTQLLKEKEIT